MVQAMRRVPTFAAAAALALALVIAAPVPARAQDQTLADIRQEMAVFQVELQRLKRELSTTGSPDVGGFGGASALERLDQLEAAHARLVSKAEQLEFRINQVVSDGTNRLDDLNFRLCEVEPGCDIGNLPPLSPIGGVAPLSPVVAPAPSGGGEGGVEMAMGEQRDFDAARALYDQGDYAGAVAAFDTFSSTYFGGPLTGEAHYWRGEALAQQGRTSEAAQAYLSSFTGAPDGSRAPDALYKLGRALGDLGQRSEACIMLDQVGQRYPGAPAAAEASAARMSMGCS